MASGVGVSGLLLIIMHNDENHVSEDSDDENNDFLFQKELTENEETVLFKKEDFVKLKDETTDRGRLPEAEKHSSDFESDGKQDTPLLATSKPGLKDTSGNKLHDLNTPVAKSKNPVTQYKPENAPA